MTVRILTGDCRTLAREIPNGSIDLVFTDPVYDRQADYFWLAETAIAGIRMRTVAPGVDAMTDQPRLIGLDERVIWTCERGVGGLTPEEMADDLRRQWDDLYRQFVAQAPNWRRTRARISIRLTVEGAISRRPERGQG